MSDGVSTLLRFAMVACLSVTVAACRVSDVLETELAANVQSVAPFQDPNTPRVDVESVRASDPEARLGAARHPQVIAENGGVYSNPKLEDLLTIITGRLIAAGEAGEPTRAYEVTILDSPLVNAFALPGGYLYITRGLLALANDTSEIAAVLAHEMAHVSASHGVARSQEARSEELVETVLADVLTNPVAGQIAAGAVKQRQAAFNQRQELQADALGIRRLGTAGFDAFAAARFLESLSRFTAWQSGMSGEEEGMSSTHPSTPRRIELARLHARAFGPEGTGERGRDRYLAAVDGMIFGDGTSDGFVRGNTFAHKKLGFAFDVPEGFDLENRDEAVLASGPGDQALRFDAVDERGDATAYLASGWVNGLDPATIRSVSIGGMEAARGRAVAGDWRFDVTVIARQGRMYRFILASPRGDTSAGQSWIAGTFRNLSKREQARLGPLRLSVANARSGDTPSALSSRMEGVKRPEALFRALNGLGASQPMAAGGPVKLVKG